MSKNIETKRRITITNLFDLAKELEKVRENVKNEKYKKYLFTLKEKVSYSINSNKVISRRDLKKVYKYLEAIKKYLKHSIWNSRKIKSKLKKINSLLGIII